MAPISQRQTDNKPESKAAQFGAVALSRPRSAQVYEGRRGSKSIIAIQASVPLPAYGIVVDAAIWGRLVSKTDGHEVEFAASAPSRMGFDDETDHDRFCQHIESAALAWAGYESATTSAYEKLTGISVTPKDAKATAEKVNRPRLVFKHPVSAEVAATVATA